MCHQRALHASGTCAADGALNGLRTGGAARRFTCQSVRKAAGVVVTLANVVATFATLGIACRKLVVTSRRVPLTRSVSPDAAAAAAVMVCCVSRIAIRKPQAPDGTDQKRPDGAGCQLGLRRLCRATAPGATFHAHSTADLVATGYSLPRFLYRRPVAHSGSVGARWHSHVEPSAARCESTHRGSSVGRVCFSSTDDASSLPPGIPSPRRTVPSSMGRTYPSTRWRHCRLFTVASLREPAGARVRVDCPAPYRSCGPDARRPCRGRSRACAAALLPATRPSAAPPHPEIPRVDPD